MANALQMSIVLVALLSGMAQDPAAPAGTGDPATPLATIAWESTVRPPMRDIHWPVASGGGSWIRDDCAMLPPPEACARLRDRRDQIRTRFFNAMPSERDVLRVEERSINARLDNDCGGH